MSHERAAEDLRREAATFAALRIQPVFPATVAEEIAKSARSWTAVADSMSADLARRAAAISAIQLPDLTALTEAMNKNIVDSIAPIRVNLDQLAAHVAQVVDFDKTYSAITAQIVADFQLRMPLIAPQDSAIAALREDALSAVDALPSEDDRQLFGEMLASIEIEYQPNQRRRSKIPSASSRWSWRS